MIMILILSIFHSYTAIFFMLHLTGFIISAYFDQLRKIIIRYKRAGYNMNVMQQTACLVLDPVRVTNFATFFNCTTTDRASDLMMASA